MRSIGFASIVRRYFIPNLFDGILTLLSYYFARSASVSALVASVITASLGLGFSGLLSSLLVEAAEMRRGLSELERVLMRALDSTVLGRTYKLAVILAALANAFAPAAGSATVVVPLLAAESVGLPAAATMAVAVALAELLTLGVYLARVSGASAFKYAAATLSAGLTIAVASMALGG